MAFFNRSNICQLITNSSCMWPAKVLAHKLLYGLGFNFEPLGFPVHLVLLCHPTRLVRSQLRPNAATIPETFW
jgi:hypothetical protein